MNICSDVHKNKNLIAQDNINYLNSLGSMSLSDHVSVNI